MTSPVQSASDSVQAVKAYQLVGYLVTEARNGGLDLSPTAVMDRVVDLCAALRQEVMGGGEFDNYGRDNVDGATAYLAGLSNGQSIMLTIDSVMRADSSSDSADRAIGRLRRQGILDDAAVQRLYLVRALTQAVATPRELTTEWSKRSGAFIAAGTLESLQAEPPAVRDRKAVLDRVNEQVDVSSEEIWRLISTDSQTRQIADVFGIRCSGRTDSEELPISVFAVRNQVAEAYLGAGAEAGRA